MSYTELQIINKAGGKVGGFGDQLRGNATLPNLTGKDKVTTWSVELYPQIRARVIQDLAKEKSPFRITLRSADLGRDFKQYDETIEDIVSSSEVVTVTTKSEHEYATGESLVLQGVRGTLAMETALNNVSFDITVLTTKTFTLDNLAGTDSWEYTENSGLSSYVPEIGGWLYAFDLPSEAIELVRQIDEDFYTTERGRREYRWDKKLNGDADGWIFVTNNFSNRAGDSAFVDYVVDFEDTTMFSDAMVECIATLLAAELCPVIGRNLETRQQLLIEYKTVSIPDAKIFNNTQFNNYAKRHTDYLGGRAPIGFPSNNYPYQRGSFI